MDLGIVVEALLLQQRLPYSFRRIDVTVGTASEALLLAGAQGRAGLGNALLKALVPHRHVKLLHVGCLKLVLQLAMTSLSFGPFAGLDEEEP
eukprot:CAMPEP_0206142364 /NCGR_PEP_ID=MMETSP1473-20131121/16589_1 /ASSEMBLY_ACC=CAM_ASM_001109 /TAXON_ID=1461547 /ORGANISM="Stichococcus sp, Strain RCC1054" /LENGTH=91 /DNA_ID=CAMNT_0053537335 /DNA_START=363 /DNA_END=639 /DNA_ORIENTATION=-